MRRLLRQPLTVAGLVVVVAFAVMAVFAPWIAPKDPTAVDVVARLAGPSGAHWLGTDALGRDLFSRIVFGARWSRGARCW